MGAYSQRNLMDVLQTSLLLLLDGITNVDRNPCGCTHIGYAPNALLLKLFALRVVARTGGDRGGLSKDDDSVEIGERDSSAAWLTPLVSTVQAMASRSRNSFRFNRR
ncbi:hypothetical protein HDU77_006637 [Chytriomyces hyalinus]|nr:hypothetical protein HDU77_006637 [Chytriomyces hyalinus]